MFFDRALLTLQAFYGGMILKDIPFSYELFWVQVHNLPLATMSQENGIQIDRRIGVVHEVDVDKEGLGWGKCLRIRVDVELTKPLLHGTMLSIGRKKIWLPIKYERL